MRLKALLAGIAAAGLLAGSAGYGIALAGADDGDPRDRGPRTGAQHDMTGTHGQMASMHGRLMRDAEMREMHRGMRRDPEMRRMHEAMGQMPGAMGHAGAGADAGHGHEMRGG